MTRLREPRRLEGGRDGGGRGARVRVGGGGWGWRGSDRMFLSIVFSFCHIVSGGEGEKGKGLPYNDGKVVHGLLRGYAGQGQDTVK